MFDVSFSGSGSFHSHGLALHSKQNGWNWSIYVCFTLHL